MAPVKAAAVVRAPAPVKAAAPAPPARVAPAAPAAPAPSLAPKQLYRVLRPILHGKTPLVVGDLVVMHPEHADQLVADGALAHHIVPQEVSRVLDAETGLAVEEGAVRAPDAELLIAKAAELAGKVETDPTKIEAAEAEARAQANAAGTEPVVAAVFTA